MFPREIEEQLLSELDPLTVRVLNTEGRASRREQFEELAEKRLWEKLSAGTCPTINTGIRLYQDAYEKHPEIEDKLDYTGKGSRSSYYSPSGGIIYAKVDGREGLFVFIDKYWSSRYKDRHGDAAYSDNEDYHVYWQEDAVIPEGFQSVGFCATDLLYLKEYLTQQGFSAGFTRSILHQALDNLWAKADKAAYFLLAVTCNFLFDYNADPLSVEFIEEGWDEGSYINGEYIEEDVKYVTPQVVELIDGSLNGQVTEMESLLRAWIDEL